MMSLIAGGSLGGEKKIAGTQHEGVEIDFYSHFYAYYDWRAFD